MIPMPLAAGADARSYPLIAQLFTRHGYTDVGDDGIEAFASRAGHTLLLFTADPIRVKETLDLAVIVPELVRAFPGRFAVGVLLPEPARLVQPRYGFLRWPALVLLKDGQYVGAIEGLRAWDEYLATMAALLEAAPARPPTVGIAVKGSDAPGAACGA